MQKQFTLEGIKDFIKKKKEGNILPDYSTVITVDRKTLTEETNTKYDSKGNPNVSDVLLVGPIIKDGITQLVYQRKTYNPMLSYPTSSYPISIVLVGYILKEVPSRKNDTKHIPIATFTMDIERKVSKIVCPIYHDNRILVCEDTFKCESDGKDDSSAQDYLLYLMGNFITNRDGFMHLPKISKPIANILSSDSDRTIYEVFSDFGESSIYVERYNSIIGNKGSYIEIKETVEIIPGKKTNIITHNDVTVNTISLNSFGKLSHKKLTIDNTTGEPVLCTNGFNGDIIKDYWKETVNNISFKYKVSYESKMIVVESVMKTASHDIKSYEYYKDKEFFKTV